MILLPDAAITDEPNAIDSTFNSPSLIEVEMETEP